MLKHFALWIFKIFLMSFSIIQSIPCVASQPNVLPPNLMPINGFQRKYASLIKTSGCIPMYKSQAVKKFRFVWLRSFHNPIVIEVDRKNNKAILYGCELSPAPDRQHYSVVQKNTTLIGTIELDKIEQFENEMKLWDATVEKERTLTTDGSIWIFEGFHDGLYYAYRASAKRDSRLWNFGMYLLNLGQQEPKDPKTIY